MEVNIDLVGREGGQGSFAQHLAGNALNIGAMRPFIAEDGTPYITVYKGGNPKKPENWKTIQANAGTLRRDEWIQLDEALVGIAENRLTGVNDLISAGLVFNLGNAMGTTVLESHDVSDAMEAELSMDAVTRSKGDRVEFGHTFLPIPIIHVDYEINQRVLEVSRRLGNPLDTTSAERAARRVAEKLEAMTFTDKTYSYGGGTIYSLVNYPNRMFPGHADPDKDVDNISDWGNPSVTGLDIVSDVLMLKQASMDNLFYGPWRLYIPSGFEVRLDEDYSTAKGSNTIRERIMQITGINAIVTVDTLAPGHIVLVQSSTDVVRIVRGLAMQNIQWQTEGGFVNKFKVISIQVPQIRSDHNGRTGLIHTFPSES